MATNLATKPNTEDQTEALVKLQEWLKPGDTVYCVLRHRSTSGMKRIIGLFIITPGRNEGKHRLIYIGWRTADLLGYRYDRDKEGIVIGGTGMDMGFELVYNLSRKLYGDGYALSHEWV